MGTTKTTTIGKPKTTNYLKRKGIGLTTKKNPSEYRQGSLHNPYPSESEKQRGVSEMTNKELRGRKEIRDENGIFSMDEESFETCELEGMDHRCPLGHKNTYDKKDYRLG